MTKFRKKPIVIEAICWDGWNVDEVLAFGNSGPVPLWGDDFKASRGGEVLIRTLEGTMAARPGDWIIRGVLGEYYPCKSNVFEANYESV